MRAGSRFGWLHANLLIFWALTLLIVGCSKPEEVISTQVSLANQKLEEGEVDEAVGILEKLNTRFPDSPAVLEALGFAYARDSKHAASASSFVRAADLDPGSSVLRQLAAETFVQAGDLTKAAEQHRLYLAEFPGDFQSWQKLGDIERQSGNLTNAIDAYLEWYRLRPTGECAYRLGRAFRELNNSPQAKTWFEATVKHADAHVQDALLGLLQLEVEAGDLAAAARTVGQLDRNFPGALDNSDLAGVRNRIASWREADEALAQARAEQERLARELAAERQARLREIEESMRTEDPPRPPSEETATSDAASEFPAETPQEPQQQEPQPSRERPITPVVPVASDQPAESTPAAAGPARQEETSPALAAAVERKEQGDLQGAVDILWRALGSSPDQVQLWVEAADCYRELNQFAQAEACILEARRLAPDSVEVETAYLNIVRASQPSDVYLARVAEARSKFPEDANLAYVFARELAQAEGDAARTIAAYEDFLLLASPEDPRRAEAAEFLARARR